MVGKLWNIHNGFYKLRLKGCINYFIKENCPYSKSTCKMCLEKIYIQKVNMVFAITSSHSR